MILDDSTELANHAMAIASAVDPGARVHVDIRAGVPRMRLLGGIAHHLGDASTVVLPPLQDPDASLHGLLQAAATLGHQAVEQATQDGTPLRERARAVGRELASAGRPLLVWVPTSWVAGEETGNPGPQIRRLRAEEVLGGWLSVENLSVVILAHSSSVGLIARSTGVTTEWRRLTIAPPTAALPDDAAWGSYANAAAWLRRTLKTTRDARLNSLQLRLLVALVGLGRAPHELLAGPTAARDLVKQLSDLLASLGGRDVSEGVRRALLARRPVPRELAVEISRVPEGHLALITDCLGEGEDVLDIDDVVREGLLARRTVDGKRPPADTRVHLALADYHESLDGAQDPTAAWSHITHWLEKTHHLGLSGPLGADRWAQLELPTRELYWDRARSLSVDHEQYVAAAELYQECIHRFDRRDAYSWHYLGYNLDRAGVRRKDAEHAFRKAVELRPDHPWYNGRLVTFLIDQARFRAAEEEWHLALERMDPDGENVAKSPWLAKEAHRWVVKAWLRFGEVRRAREVLDDIPEERFSDEPWYQDLREAVEDAEEALLLGESVYPSTTRMNERWIVPREVLMLAPDHHALRSWFPGRVMSSDADGIHLVLAVPGESAEKRRLISRTLTLDEWQRHALPAPHAGVDPEEGRFVYLAIYEHASDPQGLVRILPQPERPARFQDEMELQTTLRYLRRGAAGADAESHPPPRQAQGAGR